MNMLKPMGSLSIWPGAKSSFLVFLTVLAMLALSVQDQGAFYVLLGVLSDAYITVSVFVAFTLCLFYGLEAVFKVNTKALMRKYKHFQVPIAAALGALPGCGGAIIVVTQYVRGRLSFGAVVAVLTSTMGDAAFLLLAQAPKTGLMVMGIGFVVGTVSGYIIDAIHGHDFLRPKREEARSAKTLETAASNPFKVTLADKAWLVLIIPGFAFGVLSALQIKTVGALSEDLFEKTILYFGTVGALLATAMWMYMALIRPHDKGEPYGAAHNVHVSSELDHPVHRVIQDTNFVTTWVILAFFIFEMSVYMTHVDLASALSGVSVFVPLMAIVIGFIPGCGPQILITTMYLNGVVPMSAQLGNAISNDGDALFPAIVLAPKAAVVATVYSALLAFAVAYGYMWLFEH